MDGETERGVDAGSVRPALLWVGLLLVWTLSTWLLEGRIHTLLRPEAVTDRLLYVAVANLLIGVGGAATLVRVASARVASASPMRAAISIGVGLTLGLALFHVAGSPSSQPWVIANAFAQVLTVTVAEVAVCWWALDAALRAWRPRAKALAPVATVLMAAPAFGLYHFAHSPPFDTWSMVGTLTVVGLGTGLFFVVSRDLYATVLVHNFAGTLGVTQALAASDRLGAYEEPSAPLLISGAIMVGILVAADRLVARHGRARRSEAASP